MRQQVLTAIFTKRKIFWCVIMRITINMMNNFSIQKKSPYFLFHHKPMLVNSAFSFPSFVSVIFFSSF